MRERKKERKCEGGGQTGEEMREKGGGTWVVGKKKEKKIKKEIKSRCMWVVGKKEKKKEREKREGIYNGKRERVRKKMRKIGILRVVKEINK
jgi:hypothetical protein